MIPNVSIIEITWEIIYNMHYLITTKLLHNIITSIFDKTIFL